MEADNTQTPSTHFENIPLSFQGNWIDFFKIWFVNLLLTIITLGLYYPWAKVRNNQYLYGNSYLAAHSFEYTANPMRILMGFLLVMGLYIMFEIASNLGFIVVALSLAAALFLMFPWIIRQSIAFRLRYTRYRGINFRFKATTWDFYKFFMLHTLLNIVTLTIIFPYTHSAFKRLIINNSYYGNTPFFYEHRVADFYFLYYIKMTLLWLALIVPIAILIGIATATVSGNVVGVIAVFSWIYYIFAIMLVKGAFDAWLANIVYNHTLINSHRMINEWDALKLAWIYFSNTFVIVCTLGLLSPWARIRLLRYKLENIGFEEIDLNAFEGMAAQDINAIGEEASDIFDFDIGFF